MVKQEFVCVLRFICLLFGNLFFVFLVTLLIYLRNYFIYVALNLRTVFKVEFHYLFLSTFVAEERNRLFGLFLFL